MRRILLWVVVAISLLGVTGAILVRTGALSLSDLGITAGSPQQDGDSLSLIHI